jgi:Protein of unknown function (DUF2637)
MDIPVHAKGSSARSADAASERAMARADLVIRRTSSATVCFLAAVAGVVSYGHMHMLALRYGEQPWTAALLPLSVDGMIIAASLALLSDSRHGRRGGILPWTLLVIASSASLAANVAVAHPMLISRIISAWPPFALIGAYEMLMRQIRQSVASRQHTGPAGAMPVPGQRSDLPAPEGGASPAAGVVPPERQLAVAASGKAWHGAGRLQRQAWQWALTHRLPDGELPTGEAIAGAFQRSPRWGRLVKSAGLNGQYDHDAGQRAA